MQVSRRLIKGIAVLSLAVCVAGDARRATAQDDFEEPEKAVITRTFVIPDQTFDNIVFGNVRGSSTALKRFLTLLELQIDEVDRACELKDAQKAKLQLAGQGDIKRYFDKIDEKRRKFQDVKTDMNKFAELQQELQPLRVDASAGLYGDNSIFTKTLARTLTAEQAAKYEEVTREKKMFRHRAKIALVIATLDNSLGMTAEQRRKLEKTLVDETRPPRENSQYDFYVILYQAAMLPEERIKPIFDDTQWKSLAPYFNQAKRMADFMKNGGYLPEGVGPAPRATFVVPPPPPR